MAHAYEVCNAPSMTVPDQSLTVIEILEKYVRGMVSPVERRTAYFGQESFDADDYDEVMRLEFSDKQEFVDETKKRKVFLKNKEQQPDAPLAEPQAAKEAVKKGEPSQEPATPPGEPK